jgi:hypothetical protein
MPLTCQSRSKSAATDDPLFEGRSYTTVTFVRWRTSKSAGPRSRSTLLLSRVQLVLPSTVVDPLSIAFDHT